MDRCFYYWCRGVLNHAACEVHDSIGITTDTSNPPFFQYDYSQSAQRLVYLFFLQQAERCPHIGRTCTVWKKHTSRKREDTTLESLGSDDTLRVSVLTKKEPEPNNPYALL